MFAERSYATRTRIIESDRLLQTGRSRRTLITALRSRRLSSSHLFRTRKHLRVIDSKNKQFLTDTTHLRTHQSRRS